MPRAIALGADGNIWFGEFAGGKIGRITPQGVITEFPIPTPDSGPRALAAGPDGNIWFSEFNAEQDRPHHAAGRDHRVRAAATRTRAPATSPPAPTATCGSSSSPATMDGRKPDGNRVGRITMDGDDHRVPDPEPDRIADQHRGRSRSQHLVHEGRASSAA